MLICCHRDSDIWIPLKGTIPDYCNYQSKGVNELFYLSEWLLVLFLPIILIVISAYDSYDRLSIRLLPYRHDCGVHIFNGGA